MPERGSKLVSALIEYADAREAELAPDIEEPEVTEVEDENQLSIADINVEAEIIDAPTPEEGFLFEQEITLNEDEVAVPLVLEDAEFIPFEEAEIPTTTEEDVVTNEENTGN